MTPDHPARQIDFPAPFYAGVPLKRGIAWVLDMVLIAVIAALALPFTAFTGIFFFPLMLLVIGFCYRWVTIAATSATWGMHLTGIRLQTTSGLPLTSGLALAHTLGYSISVALPPLQLISVVMMLVTARRQGLTDLILGTEAVNSTA